LASLSRFGFLDSDHLQYTNLLWKQINKFLHTFIIYNNIVTNKVLSYHIRSYSINGLLCILPYHFDPPLHHFVVASFGNDLIRSKFSSILVFGDSTVDTGNNNYIKTLAKGNHFPYGKDFPGHVPTGRFSNGKLVPDFIASVLNLKDTVPPFLQPNLSHQDLLTGVNFASAGSGFDDLTTALTGAIAVFQQIEYFKVYVGRLKGIAGEDEAKQILRDSLVIISAGTNDFLFNFYDISTRKLEFNIDGYQDYVQNRLQIFIKVRELFIVNVLNIH